MHPQKTLKFEGLAAEISLSVDQSFFDILPNIFANWPYEISDLASQNCFFKVTQVGRKFTVSSNFMDNTETFKEPVNVACCLIVELAWARLRHDPTLLCLHGAAVEINGRLLVFPTLRKSGKSTLSVAMMAAGHRLFTDDFLPLKIGSDNLISGLSHGIAPRLRLPAPDQFGATAKAFTGNRGGVSNRQYRYVRPRAGELAHFGDSAPLGALVFLDRQPGAEASLRPMGAAPALKALITQNFSRAMNAAGILETLVSIVQMTPAFVLRYDEIEPVPGMIADKFENWADNVARLTASQADFSAAPNAVPVRPLENWETCELVQSADVKDITLEGDRFLAAPNGREIHHLNASASMIWQILAEPTKPDEVSTMVAAIFPEQPASKIGRDVHATLAAFVGTGLICKATSVCFDANSRGHYRDTHSAQS